MNGGFFSRIPMDSAEKRSLECHPERSEGSQVRENTRFFAALRMTKRLDEGVFQQNPYASLTLTLLR